MDGAAIVKMAWRNLWRQRRRTVLTLLSIAFGVFLAVIMTATQDRSFADFIDNAARFGAGHVTIQHPEYQDIPTLSRSVSLTDAERSATSEAPDVVKVVDRTAGQAMVSTASDSFGAFFVAYDPEREDASTMEITQGLASGKLFTRSDDDGIILGETLARNLSAELGDKVVFTLTDRNGEIVTGMERVSGTVRTGSVSTDAALVLLPIGTIRSVIGYDPTETTQVAVFLEDGRDSLKVARRLRAEQPQHAVLTWDEVQPEIRAFVAMKIGGGRVMEMVIGLLVAAGIFNTILMSVLERTREFGIMVAIGYSPTQLFAMVMAESAMLAGLGLVLGVLITAAPYAYLSRTGIDISQVMQQQGMESFDIGGVGMDSVMRIGIYPENAAVIALAVVVATLAAGVYPAWKAGRVDPVASINLV